MCFPSNLGEHLSIDETSFSNGELYTIVTNKDGHGKKGSLIAMIKGTKATTCADGCSVNYLSANGVKSRR